MPVDALSEAHDPRDIRIPTYRMHRASGQAVVTLAGRDVYLGPYGTPASRREYRRRIAEWLAAGSPRAMTAAPAHITVQEVILAYWRHVTRSYDAATREGTIRPTLRRLRLLYGPTSVREFGPLALKAFRQSLVDERDDTGGRLSRPYVNRSIQWVRRLFRWAVSEQLVEPSILHALEAVEPLRYGRTDAPEPKAVGPVPDATVEATLPHLPPVVADMVRLQRLAASRSFGA